MRGSVVLFKKMTRDRNNRNDHEYSCDNVLDVIVHRIILTFVFVTRAQLLDEQRPQLGSGCALM